MLSSLFRINALVATTSLHRAQPDNGILRANYDETSAACQLLAIKQFKAWLENTDYRPTSTIWVLSTNKFSSKRSKRTVLVDNKEGRQVGGPTFQ
jgi:hypothetical protein